MFCDISKVKFDFCIDRRRGKVLLLQKRMARIADSRRRKVVSELKNMQKRYLYHIHRCERENRTLSGIVAAFGMDKGNVSKLLAVLEQQGFLNKEGRFYELSEKGRAALSPQAEQAEILCLWLRGSGFDERSVRGEAFNMVLGLTPRMAAWMVSAGLFLFAAFHAGARTQKELVALSGAGWMASILFLKPGGGKSMGNRGISDCRVALKSKRLYLEFASKRIRRSPEAGADSAGAEKGRLTRFWYKPRGADEWREVASGRNLWRVPLDETEISFDDGLLRARVRVRALAGERCGMSGNEEADMICTVKLDEFFFRKG
jgi:DNA-binding MarR family transcriptional regulator